MNVVMPQHYALTDAIVLTVGVFAIFLVTRVNRWLAVGLAPFVLAALVGTIRISVGLVGPIVTLHQFLSRTGAVFGLGCLVGALAVRSAWLPPALGLVAAVLVILAPGAATSIFAVLVVAGAVLAYRSCPDKALLAAASFSLLLVGRVVTDPLRSTSPALAWHMFHMAVALWLWQFATLMTAAHHRASNRNV